MRIDLVQSPDLHPADRIVDILLSAFRDDPLFRGLFPADLDYVTHFPGLAAAFAANALAAGTAEITAGGHGAALWFPPGTGPDRAAVRRRLASLPARRFAFASDGLEMLDRLRPDRPHWYLPWLGVAPEAQGAGFGSALIAAGVARADRDGVPVYAEATTRRGAALYARHGFETWARMTLPGCPETIAMLRRAGGPSAPTSYSGL